ncbi:MAG: hypothetical protein KAU89_04000, partial [Candidatus Thorarchaeota archaeon]|nr:hypothetical protein [Candidatus Thorarchaeota archaeon]
SIRDFVYVHLLFAVVAAAVLLIPATAGISARMLVVVIAYNVMIPLVALQRGHTEWIRIWLFVFALSILQIWPDWFLSAELGVLAFPDDGFFMIGTVPVYMAGIWAIPLFVIIYVGQVIQRRWTDKWVLAIVGALTLTIFVAAEATMWMLPSWSAQGVAMIGHVAVYIIVPEIVLGLSTYITYDVIRERPLWMIAIAAFLVMVLYLGCAVLSFFMIERVLLGV